MLLGACMVLASTVLFVANSVLAWRDGWAMSGVATRAGAAGATMAMAGVLALLTVLAVGRRSVVALWLLVFMVGVAVVVTGYRAVSGLAPDGMITALAVVDAALASCGVVLLLIGRGTRAWFARREA